jgi:hypothetical protein
MATSPFDDLARFCELLSDTDIHCIIVGSIAAMHFGEPRATIDIDLVLNALPEDADRIASAFRDERFYVPPISVIMRELGRTGGQFTIIDTTTGLKADCYSADKDELGQYQFAHAIAGVLGTTPVYFAPPAAVIAKKLQYHAMSHQDKHLRDIRAMLALSPELIDLRFLDHWTETHGFSVIWRQCRSRVGEI